MSSQRGEMELMDKPGAESTSTAKEIFAAVKGVNTADSSESLEDPHDGEVSRQTKSTHKDLAGMHRMGKDQQLIRHFRLISMLCFVGIATAAWEIGLFILTPGLVDGGRAGLIYNTLWNFIGFGPVYLSMAEMASMAPIAGAQYHWVRQTDCCGKTATDLSRRLANLRRKIIRGP